MTWYRRAWVNAGTKIIWCIEFHLETCSFCFYWTFFFLLGGEGIFKFIESGLCPFGVESILIFLFWQCIVSEFLQRKHQILITRVLLHRLHTVWGDKVDKLYNFKRKRAIEIRSTIKWKLFHFIANKVNHIIRVISFR